MSDSIKKWHEMQEEKESKTSSTSPGTFIYESPDGGKTVKKRAIEQPIIDSDKKKQAYRLLCEYDEEVIKLAYKILNAV